MAAQPYLVAGRGRFDTAVLEAAGAVVTVKVGGAAVWVALLRPAGPALAIKLEAGDATALPAWPWRRSRPSAGSTRPFWPGPF